MTKTGYFIIILIIILLVVALLAAIIPSSTETPAAEIPKTSEFGLTTGTETENLSSDSLFKAAEDGTKTESESPLNPDSNSNNITPDGFNDSPPLTEPNAEILEETGNVKIIYKGEQFLPANVTIKANATVTFRNESESPLWVASNPHPLHTSSKELNSPRPLNKGEVYEIPLSLAGRFGYHNHLNPSQGGIIIVTQ